MQDILSYITAGMLRSWGVNHTHDLLTYMQSQGGAAMLVIDVLDAPIPPVHKIWIVTRIETERTCFGFRSVATPPVRRFISACTERRFACACAQRAIHTHLKLLPWEIDHAAIENAKRRIALALDYANGKMSEDFWLKSISEIDPVTDIGDCSRAVDAVTYDIDCAWYAAKYSLVALSYATGVAMQEWDFVAIDRILEGESIWHVGYMKKLLSPKLEMRNKMATHRPSRLCGGRGRRP